MREVARLREQIAGMERAHDELKAKVDERTTQLSRTTEILEAENSERKKAAKEVEKVNRALRVLGKCNVALVHATDYESFLNEICQIIVEDGKYLMAWIGYPVMDRDQTVQPVACAGRVNGYLDIIKISSVDNEWGRGPTGTAIRTGEVCVRNDMLNDTRFAPWAKEASIRGYASSIGLPLKANEEQCFGALTIYAAEKDIFIEEEKKLLKELADNIAFGITNLQMRAKNRLAEGQLEKSYEQLRSLAGHLQSVREEERTNIAREIHDEIGQIMTAIKMDVAWLREKYSDHDGIHEKTSSTLALINSSIKSMKRICTELRPEILDHFGLGAAIEWQAQEFRKRSGIECEVVLNPDVIIADINQSTALFRIFQEALTNIHRHSKATKVDVTLTEEENSIMLEIADNGIGVTEEQLLKANSFGLLGMKERVHILNGELRIKGVKDKGTVITVLIPGDNSLGARGLPEL